MNKRTLEQVSSIYLALFLSFTVLLASTCDGKLVCLEQSVIKDMAKQLSSLSKASGRPAWPPATPSYRIDPRSGKYSLALNPPVEPNRQMMDWKNYWFTRLFHLYCQKAPKGSWLKQVLTMNRKIGYKVLFMPEYSYYPPVVDVKDMVQTMRAGKPLPVPPYFNPDIQVVRYPFTCSAMDNNRYDLIVVMNSYVTHVWHRAQARKTFMKKNLWRGLKVAFFFVMGMPAPVRYRTVNFYGLRVRQPQSYRKGLNQAKATAALLREADTYKDILIGNYADEFYNMTLRFVVRQRWTSLYCSQRSPLFLFIDESYVLVPFHVTRFVKKIPKKNLPNYYAGRLFWKMGISRVPENKVTSHRYAVSHNELPYARYPTFASRAALFLGRESLNDLTVASLYTRFFRFTDVYIGITMHRMGRKAKHIPQFHFWTNRNRVRRNGLGGFFGSTEKHVNWRTGRPL